MAKFHFLSDSFSTHQTSSRAIQLGPLVRMKKQQNQVTQFQVKHNTTTSKT